MSKNSESAEIELDDDVANALAAIFFGDPSSGSPGDPDLVIDLRDNKSDEVVDTKPQPEAEISPAPRRQLFPSPAAERKPVPRSSTPLFPTLKPVERQNGDASGLFGPDRAPHDVDGPKPVSKFGPMVRATPSSVEFVPAVETKDSRNYRVIGGLALGAVAAVGALLFAFSGGNDAPAINADVSLIPATQISNTTPTTTSVATTLTTAPPTTEAPTTAAPTTEAPTTAAPTTAAPAAPAATRPPTTRRPATTSRPATTAPPTTVAAATIPTLDIPPATYLTPSTAAPAPVAETGAETVATP